MDAIATIRKEMVAQAMTQSDLSRRSGVPKYTINKWFAGRTRPMFYDVVKISKALRVPLDYIATGEDRFRDLKRHSMQRWIDVGRQMNNEQLFEAIGIVRATVLVNKLSTSVNSRDPDYNDDSPIGEYAG